MLPRLPIVVGKAVFTTLVLVLLFFRGTASAQSGYSLRSPDQKIEVRIRTGDRFKYDVLFDGRPLLRDSELSIKIDSATLGHQPRVKTTKPRAVNQEIVSPVPQKSARIREDYNELKLEM